VAIGTMDAVALAQAIRLQEISAGEAVDAALAQIDELDPYVHAFCTLASDPARREAAAIDARLRAGERIGPLAGVPVAVKDLIATRNLRTTFGSPLYAEFMPSEDDVVVQRLKAAGAIVIGKTNTSEFGYGPIGHNPLFPATRNPWNLALTSGGSSAGTAAAIACGMVPAGLGSDGGGSIRIPAALCGVVGMKASWGRVPLYPGCRDETLPGASGWESLEHIGPMARSVRDIALILAVLAGPSQKDRHSLPAEPGAFDISPPERLRGARIAFSADLGFATVDREVRVIAAAAARRFERDLGCHVAEIAPPIGNVQATFEALVALDTDRTGLRRLAAQRGHAFSGALQDVLAREWTADAFTDAILERKRIANIMWRFMTEFDFLLTPTTAAAAFPVGRDGPAEIDGVPVPPSAWTPFSTMANFTGQPAATIPAGFTQDGRPVGLQIMGRRLDDAGVLTACAAFEAIQPWAGRRPPIGDAHA
jgi:aspartyl-tRNA(Asn)/glutamyl-tRNA(Gln) amidotransferase subunit A